MAVVTSKSLSRLITDALLNTLCSVDPLYRPHMKWVMNEHWHAVLVQMGDDYGEYWAKNATTLYGLPFEVTSDGGAPHLEAALA